jgi:hypothetical protein
MDVDGYEFRLKAGTTMSRSFDGVVLPLLSGFMRMNFGHDGRQ